MRKIVFEYAGEPIDIFEAAGRPTEPVELEIVVPKGTWPTITFKAFAKTLPERSKVTVDFSAGPVMGSPLSVTNGTYSYGCGAGEGYWHSGGGTGGNTGR